jgi:transcriptional regulator with XRE-family HTH domain
MKPEDMETLAEFAAELKYLRDRAGLSREEVEEIARDAGTPISHATVSNMCGGHVVPSKLSLRVFLNVVGVEDEEAHEAWQQARERFWKVRVRQARERPAEPEDEYWELRKSLARIEGMLTALAREWGIGKRDE